MSDLIGFGNILFFVEPGENPGLLVQSSYAMPTERLDREQCETLYAELGKLLGKPELTPDDPKEVTCAH